VTEYEKDSLKCIWPIDNLYNTGKRDTVMSVIVEFTIEADAFQMGRVLSGPPTMHVELERVVPIRSLTIPFIWVTGDDHEAFRRSVRNHSSVLDVTVLQEVDESVLYRIESDDTADNLIKSFVETDASVLEAHGTDDWSFQLRFEDHAKLSQFHNYLITHKIDLHIERTYTLSRETKRGHQFGLTHEQREALVLALRRGYFETPKEVSLDELAQEFEISRQALSTRIRLGNQKVLRKVLLPQVGDSY